jgi:endonuclease YncB( thermonuclease family)
MHRRTAVIVVAMAAASACSGPASDTTSTGHPPPPATTSEAPGLTVPPPGDARRVRVVAVLDGDSLEVEIDGAVEEVRIRRINAPEQGECWGDAARHITETILDGTEVMLTADGRDQYGRLLADVWADGTSVALSLIREGAALALSAGEDGAGGVFLEAEEAAYRAGSGLWAEDACGPASDARVAITEVRFDAPGPDDENPNGEWIVLGNDGPAAELTGWVLRDESSVHRFEFPEGFVLAQSADVVVRSGCGSDREDALFWCAGAVWSNSGDTALLLDPHGNVVDRVRL